MEGWFGQYSVMGNLYREGIDRRDLEENFFINRQIQNRNEKRGHL